MEYSLVVAMRLQEALGQRLVAYAVGIRSSPAIGRFARGEEVPDEAVAGKLVRLLGEVVEPILAVDSSEVLRAWLLGANPSLDDQAPIEVFRKGELDAVKRAAEHFVHNS